MKKLFALILLVCFSNDLIGGMNMIGSVYALKYDKNYGFIYVDGGDQYFFHRNELRNCTMYQLTEGDVVEFDTKEYNGKIQAANVRKKYQAEPKANMANPGINPMVKMEHFNEDEKQIIKALGKVFYVTSGGIEFTIGESTYRYCLIKPTDYFIQTFQLSRELVVIFTDYVSFEPRSLDAAAYVYRTISSKLRLDRGCHVLICHDDQIESKLAELLKDNNVNQIVIPFTYRELLSDTYGANTIHERFRKYLFDTDLFATSKPIQNDIFFFGRRDLVHDIVSKCKNNTNCGVFGLRRSGKTSVLYAVEGLLHQQNYPTVFVPCESDLSSLDWRTALYKLAYNVAYALDKDPTTINASLYQTFDTVMYFERDMNTILKDTLLPVTIMFDEIEAITFSVLQGEESDNLWVDGDSFVYFWNTLKGYYSKYPKKLSILVAGTNPMINEVPIIGKKKQANPMFRQLSESNQGAYLQAFSHDDTKNMVNTLGGYMGITFDEYCISRLTSDCGGHPYLMRILCSYINRFARSNNIQRPVVITKAIYDKAMPEFEKSSEAASFFWMILNILMTSYCRANMSHYKGGVTVQKSIRTIQAEPTLPTRLRVAAYARVSSDKDTMLHSLAEQVSKYSRMIQSNTAWEYAGVYADEGITGTTEDRPEFQRLLADCRAGKIDMIICPKCNKAYRHVTSNGSTGWNCSTYMSEGKAKCHGKKIPDTTLRCLIAELLGMPEYDPAAFGEVVDSIFPYEGNRLVFAFKDGTVREATWKDRSRSESWTPEMKAKARENSKRRTTCGK